VSDFSPSIPVGDRTVGAGHPCYVIAEAGSNHNGRLDLALELIDAAADAGCDAVKFQVFRAEELMSPTGPRAAYLNGAMDADETLFELFSRAAMDRDWLPMLAEHARAAGVHFLATPFDLDAVERLVAPDVAVPALKLASSELWHLPLLAAAAAAGPPLIISTGMARLPDVDQALEAVRAAGGRQVCLLHCTVSYPTPAASVNLRAMETLANTYGTPVGLSDHTDGIWAAIAAAALGANVLEKHFTLSRTLDGPDHKFAIEPRELVDLVEAVRNTEVALGDGRKERNASEDEIYRLGRRNVVALRHLPSGHRVGSTDVAILRSPLGIAPADLDRVIGRRIQRDVVAGSPLQWEDLDSANG
jgi:N,N'-diacetyllegionaminate synthase